MYFHRTVRDRTATVWRRCSVAIDVVIDRWRCRPDVEGGGSAYYVRFLLKTEPGKKKFFWLQKIYLAKKFVKRTVR